MTKTVKFWIRFGINNEMKKIVPFFKWRQILDAIPREWKGVIVRDREFWQEGIVNPEPTSHFKKNEVG